jgi:hypothetical protein
VQRATAQSKTGIFRDYGVAEAPAGFKSSQVKSLITNYSFCIVQRATARSKTGIFRDCGVAEAPPGFQAGWSDCMHFLSLFLFILFAHLEIMQPRHSSP